MGLAEAFLLIFINGSAVMAMISLIDLRIQILKSRWTRVGCGVIKNTTGPSEYRYYYCQMFIGWIYFADGSSIPVSNIIIPPVNSEVEVYRNGCAEFKITVLNKTKTA